MPNTSYKEKQRRLSEAKKHRIQIEAELLYAEYKHVPRTKLRHRSGVCGDEYQDFMRFCDEMQYPKSLPPDIPDAEWEQLLIECNYTCLDCGRSEPEISLTKDHVWPIELGGSHDISNLQPLCKECNNKKNQRTIDYRQRETVPAKGSIR